MRRRVLTAVAAAVVALTTIAPAAVDTKPAVTAATLRPHLLTVKDLPSGWSVNAQAPPNTPDPTGGPCDGPNAAARAETVGSTATAEANLIKDPRAGPLLFEVVYGFPTIRQAKAFMETNRAVLASCPSSERVNPVNGRSYHDAATKVSFPRIGEDTIAFKQTDAPVDGVGAAGAFDDVYVRRGALVLSMSVGGQRADSKLTAVYTRTALDKLARLTK